MTLRRAQSPFVTGSGMSAGGAPLVYLITRLREGRPVGGVALYSHTATTTQRGIENHGNWFGLARERVRLDQIRGNV